MADINGVNATSVYEQINKSNQASSTAKSQSETDSDMFMKLMIAQLKNQDPTSPADTADFMQQISNMSSVESINNLNTTMSDMSSALLTSQAALQASSMVGQTAFVKTDKAMLDSRGIIEGVYTLPESAKGVRVSVYDSVGDVVDTWEMKSVAAGDHNFGWNVGNRDPQSEYKVVVEATDSEGVYKPTESYIGHRVDSVTLGQNGIGMKVNTGAGTVNMSDIKQIG
ncbi:flagellar hook assembly protein FlgD [Neptunomonas japonica]|jgi:flagellar basal-body rod modification protein FlgD|uniref:Basal-body rod modification protein FlgD n=1 Tax=Neptunomonas japonica JAMM 1380 TaxID=1441457 RepID=A0A7R6PA27_9GAMM|nr:flagellar hook capping FlgD N-terminal domain-containing protein [Neptunomonas japonica]BBB28644.1 flagellar basal-body rod modification protein FlgD [Neptunomonas japonica JAMM 1380]